MLDNVTRKVILVRFHVEITVTAQIQQNCSRNAFFLTLFGLSNRGGDTVRGLWRWYNTLSFSEFYPGREYFQIIMGTRFDELISKQLTHDHSCSMISEPTRMNGSRHKVMT